MKWTLTGSIDFQPIRMEGTPNLIH